MSEKWIYRTALRKGTAHKVYCEDFLVVERRGRTLWMAVFDGCSSGRESHFASALLGKLFRQGLPADEGRALGADEALAACRARVPLALEGLRSASALLGLGPDELLSTMLLARVDLEERSAAVLAVGDGLFSVDGRPHVLDQGNRPAYMAYQLAAGGARPGWLEELPAFHFEGAGSLALGTDGLLSFGLPDGEDLEKALWLCHDRELLGSQAMLDRKLNLLRARHGLEPQDDLALARVDWTD